MLTVKRTGMRAMARQYKTWSEQLGAQNFGSVSTLMRECDWVLTRMSESHDYQPVTIGLLQIALYAERLADKVSSRLERMEGIPGSNDMWMYIKPSPKSISAFLFGEENLAQQRSEPGLKFVD